MEVVYKQSNFGTVRRDISDNGKFTGYSCKLCGTEYGMSKQKNFCNCGGLISGTYR